MNFFSSAMYIYPCTSLVLYAVLTYASASICNLTIQQMSRLKDKKEEISDRECLNHLQTWKVRQELLNQTVEAINDCFGFTLLIASYSLSISIVNTTFYIFCGFMDDYSNSQMFPYFSFITNFCLILALISFPADYLASAVSRFFQIQFFLKLSHQLFVRRPGIC